ncbi:hypothetical protein GGI21_006030, partial [Coemansia aciculifera]
MPTLEETTQSTVTTVTGATYDMKQPPANVREPLWTLVISSLMRMNPQALNQRPRKSVLHWVIQNSETPEELAVAHDLLAVQWRMCRLSITQATTQIWAEACMRLHTPHIFVAMLMDQWKYRQLPINYNMARFIRYLGTRQLLDDAFRLFALYPYY